MTYQPTKFEQLILSIIRERAPVDSDLTDITAALGTPISHLTPMRKVVLDALCMLEEEKLVVNLDPIGRRKSPFSRKDDGNNLWNTPENRGY